MNKKYRRSKWKNILLKIFKKFRDMYSSSNIFKEEIDEKKEICIF